MASRNARRRKAKATALAHAVTRAKGQLKVDNEGRKALAPKETEADRIWRKVKSSVSIVAETCLPRANPRADRIDLMLETQGRQGRIVKGKFVPKTDATKRFSAN